MKVGLFCYKEITAFRGFTNLVSLCFTACHTAKAHDIYTQLQHSNEQSIRFKLSKCNSLEMGWGNLPVKIKLITKEVQDQFKSGYALLGSG